MTIQTEAKRVKTGQSLLDKVEQATVFIDNLKILKAQLLEIKATVAAGGDYTAEDLTVVNNYLAELANKLSTI